MSASSEKVRKAIFAKSNVPALVGPGLLTKIYESKAANDAVKPYGIFGRHSPGQVTYSFGPKNVNETDLWLFKVIADRETSGSKEPQEIAEDMLNLWETTLGNSLTLSGNTVVWMSRFADMPPFEEKLNDRFIFHRGFLMRIDTE